MLQGGVLHSGNLEQDHEEKTVYVKYFVFVTDEEGQY